MTTPRKEAFTAFHTALQHLGRMRVDSARICLLDASELLSKEEWEAAKQRSLASLAHSVGKHHPDYRKLDGFLVFGPESRSNRNPDKGDPTHQEFYLRVGDKVTTTFDQRDTATVVRTITALCYDSTCSSGVRASVDGGDACPTCQKRPAAPIEGIDAGWFSSPHGTLVQTP
jgi:hypothetical protein